MRVFNADEWHVGMGVVSIETAPVQSLDLSVSCTEAVEVYGMREGAEHAVLLHVTKGSETFRAKFKGFVSIDLYGPDKVEFGYRAITRVMQDGEPIDHENPPAPPAPNPKNMLAQIRQLMRDEFTRNRLHLLEPEELPFADRYLVDEDDYDFEEERGAKALAARKRKREENVTPPSSEPPVEGEAENPPAPPNRTPPQPQLSSEAPRAAE